MRQTKTHALPHQNARPFGSISTIETANFTQPQLQLQLQEWSIPREVQVEVVYGDALSSLSCSKIGNNVARDENATETKHKRKNERQGFELKVSKLKASQ